MLGRVVVGAKCEKIEKPLINECDLLFISSNLAL